MSPVPQPGLFRAIIRVTDWRLVAAIGLPLWAFLIGIVVADKSAPHAPRPPGPVESAAVVAPSPQPAPPLPPPTATPVDAAPLFALFDSLGKTFTSPAAAPVEVAPLPREAVVRTEVAAVAVPPSTPPESVASVAPAAPEKLKLPASEPPPADRCNTFNTKIHFHPDLGSAETEAKSSKKMVLVLHISGNFDDPGFT
jgi:hypothetical protein